MNQARLVTIVSLISPTAELRAMARSIHAERQAKFLECYIEASVETCIARDPKGLYQRAQQGEIKNFTGISRPLRFEDSRADIENRKRQPRISSCPGLGDTLSLKLLPEATLHQLTETLALLRDNVDCSPAVHCHYYQGKPEAPSFSSHRYTCNPTN